MPELQQIKQIKKEINITYETIFDFLIREKNRAEIQKLPDTYFSDIIEYLNEKTVSLQNKNRDEMKILEHQLDNAKRLIKELYDRREKKIVLMALNQARLRNNEMKIDTLLYEEKQLFNEVSKVLSSVRINVINQILQQLVPNELYDDSEMQKYELNEVNNTGYNSSPSEVKLSDHKNNIDKHNNEKKQIKFITNIPRFFDENMQVLGPFEEGTISEIPDKIAQLLINKGKAVELT